MDLHKEMREMVAYLLDTDDSETIESYTKTFTAIALEYHNEQLRLLSVGKSLKEKEEKPSAKYTNDIDKRCIDFAEWINNQNVGYHSEKREWYFYKKSKWINTKDLMEVYKKENLKK